jgi:hypothetical protein
METPDDNVDGCFVVDDYCCCTTLLICMCEVVAHEEWTCSGW